MGRDFLGLSVGLAGDEVVGDLCGNIMYLLWGVFWIGN